MSFGAVKTRAKSARLLSAMQAKRLFFFEEDLGTGFFTTNFPFSRAPVTTVS